MRTGAAAGVLVAVLSGCGGDATEADAFAPSPTPRALGIVGGSSQDFSIFYRTFEDFVTESSLVFEGEVVSEARGVVTTQPEVREQSRTLQIEVHEVLSGFRPETSVLRVDTCGWRQVVGRPEQVDHACGALRVEVGDVGIFNVGTSDKQVYGFINDQAVFLLHDGEVRDTGRGNAFVREVESLSAAELRERIRETAARMGRSPG